MSKRIVQIVFPMVFAGLLAAQMALPGKPRSLKANLTGLAEIPPVWTAGAGEFRAVVSDDDTQLAIELSFDGLTGPAAAAHIHFAPPHANGGVMIHLCGSGGAPACPLPGQTLSRTLLAGDVVAIQGLQAGDLQAALKIIRSGLAYVNVHTAAFPGGEIRGHIRPGGGACKGKGKGLWNNDEDDAGSPKAGAKGKGGA